MTFRNLTEQIATSLHSDFAHPPTEDQCKAIAKLAYFLSHDQESGCFILTGYAGTGKTSLIGALVRTLKRLEIPFLLAAPTGRAAKVLGRASQHYAGTIHRTIYQVQEGASGFPSFARRFNDNAGAVIVVDEASMVGDGQQGAGFGAGQSLLEDLIRFVKEAPGCRLLLVGDSAQLPPIGQSSSPALDPALLLRDFEEVESATLQEVVRQSQESGILHYATKIRQDMAGGRIVLPRFSIRRYPDFRKLESDEHIDVLGALFTGDKVEESIILCRSNRKANAYNSYIRRSILDREDVLSPGDRIMVCRNSYHWTKGNKKVPFLANGDIATVARVFGRVSKYDMQFAEIELIPEDYSSGEIAATAMLDVLALNSPALQRPQAQALYQSVQAEVLLANNGRPNKKEIQENPYLNALQIKYGYAVTCHKAQGGQWENVLIDLELYAGLPTSRDLLRWIYTAITRATKRIYLIAPPKGILEADSLY